MTSRGSQDSNKLSLSKSKTQVGMSLVFVRIFTFWMRYFILSQTVPKKKNDLVSCVDCVTAAWLVLIIDACLHFCCSSFFKKISDHSEFFCSFFHTFFSSSRPASKTHNVLIPTYHTEAHKKLNPLLLPSPRSLRWTLCRSGHFAFQSHYMAVLLRLSAAQTRENSVCPCDRVPERRFRNES